MDKNYFQAIRNTRKMAWDNSYQSVIRLRKYLPTSGRKRGETFDRFALVKNIIWAQSIIQLIILGLVFSFPLQTVNLISYVLTMQMKYVAEYSDFSNWQSVDHLRRSFIELPIPDESFMFIESASHNVLFRPYSLFIPVQAIDEAYNGIWEVDMTNDSDPQSKLVAQLPQRGQFFGSKISDDGRMFICTHDSAEVLVVDLDNGKLLHTIQLEKAPNDIVLIDSSDGAIHFIVCCNSNKFGIDHSMNALEVQAMDSGVVYEVSLHAGKTTIREIASGMKVVAGIALLKDSLWVSEVTSLIKIDNYEIPSKTKWSRGFGDYDPSYLADNLVTYSEKIIAFPMFTRVNSLIRMSTYSNMISWIALRLIPMLNKALVHFDLKIRCEPPILDSLRFVLYHVEEKKSLGFSLSVPSNHSMERVLDPRGLFPSEFDSRVTHVERIDDKLFFINYSSKKVLVLHNFNIGHDKFELIESV